MTALVVATEGLDGLATAIEREHGVSVPVGVYSMDWESFFERAELRDVLDTVSTAVGVLAAKSSSAAGRSEERAVRWIGQVRRIFTEEHLAYRVTDRGAVRYAIDEQFDRSRLAALAVLGGDRYTSTRGTFELAYEALSGVPPQGKAAIRATFSALEGLFRLMFPKAPRLGAAEAESHLLPHALAAASDDIHSRAIAKLVRSFREWIDGAHFYRHEQGRAEPNEPPIELAVYFVSSGAAWLRWLAEIDLATTK